MTAISALEVLASGIVYALPAAGPGAEPAAPPPALEQTAGPGALAWLSPLDAPAPPQSPAAPDGAIALSPPRVAEALLGWLAEPGQAPQSAEALVVFNAAMIPGWPFPDAVLREAPAARRQALRQISEAALPGPISPEELAEAAAPFAALHRLRALLKQIERIDRKTLEALALLILNAVHVVANGISLSLALGHEGPGRPAHLALRDELPSPHVGRLRVRV